VDWCHNSAMPAAPHVHDDAVRILDSTLRDNSRPIALLVGAGAGCSILTPDGPLIPAIAGLTDLVRSTVTPRNGSLSILEASFVADGKSGATIEDWLSRVRTLLTIVGSSDVRGLDAAALEGLEKSIVEAVAQIVAKDLPDEQGGYGEVARWAAGFDRSHPVEIFTLSYDLLMEQALERAQVAYFDGFLGSFQPFLDLRTMEEDTLPTRWARLWKMHGSINWKMKDGQAFRTADWSSANIEGALIHPSHMKYDQSRRMPYLAMQDRLRAFMKQPGAAIITIGYSFGDQHINELIEEGLRVNQAAVCFGLLFDKLANFREATEFATRSTNLRLQAPDAAVIGGREGAWERGPAGGALPNLGDFNEFGRLLARLTAPRS